MVGVTVLLAVVVYLPSLGNGYALDDVGDIVENPAVHGLGDVPGILVSPYRGRVPPERSPYRPVTSLSYALSWSMGDGAPLAFHAFNVGLHGASTALVTGLLMVMGATPAGALVGGAIFAVHPVHSEAVANGVGRADALMTLFVLLGILAYLRPWRSEWTRIAVVAGAYALALGAKENGVVLPALLVAVTLLAPARSGGIPPSRSPRPPRSFPWLLFAVLAAVLLAYLAARHGALGTLVHRDAAPYIVILGTGTRMATAVANATELARLLLFPADLAADYGPDVIVPAAPWSARFWGGLAVALGLVALGALGVRLGRWWLSLGAAWIVLTVSVVGNVVFPVGVWVAERTLYLPSVGVSFLAFGAWQLASEAPRRVRAALLGIVAALVLLGGARTWTRNAAWADTEAVLSTLAREHPESYRAQWWVGLKLLDAGELDRGVEWLRRAGDRNPNELRVQLDLVRGLLLSGRSREALEAAAGLPPLDPARDVYLARSHIQLGRLEEARAAVREGLSRFPDDPRLRRQARELGLDPRTG